MLCIYSGEVPALDALLRARLDRTASFTMIPYTAAAIEAAEEAQVYFSSVDLPARVLPQAHYADPQQLAQAVLASAAVYLSGGNTYEFLDYARRSNLFPLLSQFEARGGVIVGESAGSIILTPDISTAGIPSSFPDDNTLGLQQLTAMGRLPFHISPHFEADAPWAQRDLHELQALADDSNVPVVVVEDGEGFVVEGNHISRYFGRQKILVPGSPIPVLRPRPAPARPYQTRGI